MVCIKKKEVFIYEGIYGLIYFSIHKRFYNQHSNRYNLLEKLRSEYNDHASKASCIYS